MPKLLSIQRKFLNLIASFLFSFCLFNCVQCQTFYKCQIRLLGTSNQIKEDTAKYFGVNAVVIDDKYLLITLNNKRRLRVSTDSVWGYKILENASIIRAFKGGLYKVKQINNLILYTQKDYGSDFFDSNYYFSFTFDSEIYLADKSTVKKVFADNPCMLNKLASSKLWQYPMDWMSKYKTIRFVIWYNECNLKK